MGLITSVSEAQALLGSKTRTGSLTGTSDLNFQEVLKSGLNKVSESMDSIFDEAAARFGISSSLVRAVAKAESNFNPKAVSRAGAMGVMQLMPGTARSLGVTDPFDARQNIMGGARYLKENLEKFGDVRLALAAYNAGPGAVTKYGGIPPYNETQNYVKKVTSYMQGEPVYANKSVATGLSSYGLGGLDGIGSLSGFNSQYGLGSLNGFGSLGGTYGLSAMSVLADGVSVSEDGETITMDKESFSSLIQLMRVQMMMNAGRDIGTVSI